MAAETPSSPAAVPPAARGELRLLIALAPVWCEQFLDDALLADLRTAYSEVVQVNPYAISAAAWAAEVARVRPHAMLTGWGTPAIPPAALPTLGCVAHTAGEVRRLVGREMIEQGLQVSNWGELAARSVAECALLLMLCTLRRVTHWSMALHQQRTWPTQEKAGVAGMGLFGRRVGLHGFGHIARSLVELLRPFGCRIAAYSAGVPRQFMLDHGVEPAESLEALFEQSEVLVEVEALTPATRRCVTEALLRRLPAGAAFVNVGRGAVVDEAALAKLAQEGRLQLGLDVYETEPLPADSPLRGLPNVTLLPHVGGPTLDRRRDCGRRAVENLLRFARGEPAIGAITLEVFDRST